MTSLNASSKSVRQFRLRVILIYISITLADPHDVDARYVHFFHEKIPSRYVSVWLDAAPMSN